MNPPSIRRSPILSPSMISVCDLCDLAASVRQLEQAGIRMLHVDLLDGVFSPSLPIGLDTVRQLHKRTSLVFDVHVMAVRNEFFLRELMDIGAEQIVFHLETEPHADYWLAELRREGFRAGVALKPATPLCQLDCILERCDVVELMLINPGFAGNPNETQVPYATRKIRDLRAMIAQRSLPVQIEIDGRVSLENIREFGHGDVDIFVAGSTCLDKNNLEAGARALRALAEGVGTEDAR